MIRLFASIPGCIGRPLAALALFAACSAAAVAAPLLSAPPGTSTAAFDVAAIHPANLNATSGAFIDVFAFSLAGSASATATALYYGDEIEGFGAQLYGGAGLIASGVNAGVGAPAALAFMNSIFGAELEAGDYEIRISGTDLYRDNAAPYSLTLAVGPATRLTASQVPEPATFALMLAAMLLLACHRQQRQAARARRSA
jgi:hypothetical protein